MTPEGPVAYFQTVYFEHLGVPLWVVNSVGSSALWHAVRSWATGFRKFQAAQAAEQAAGGEGCDAAAVTAAQAQYCTPDVVGEGRGGVGRWLRGALARGGWVLVGVAMGARWQHGRERRRAAERGVA